MYVMEIILVLIHRDILQEERILLDEREKWNRKCSEIRQIHFGMMEKVLENMELRLKCILGCYKVTKYNFF
jgi:hypothetical protein